MSLMILHPSLTIVEFGPNISTYKSGLRVAFRKKADKLTKRPTI